MHTDEVWAKAAGVSVEDYRAQRVWDDAHTTENGGVVYPDVECGRPWKDDDGDIFERWNSTAARKAERADYHRRVDKAKVLQWALRYRIIVRPRKGWFRAWWFEGGESDLYFRPKFFDRSIFKRFM